MSKVGICFNSYITTLHYWLFIISQIKGTDNLTRWKGISSWSWRFQYVNVWKNTILNKDYGSQLKTEEYIHQEYTLTYTLTCTHTLILHISHMPDLCFYPHALALACYLERWWGAKWDSDFGRGIMKVDWEFSLWYIAAQNGKIKLLLAYLSNIGLF